MGDLRPLGSEKMQGMDKLKRIMEIARYNEAPKQEINELSTTNYIINLADGKTYGIVREKLGYIIKCGLNESTLDYSDPIRQRKYYRAYSEAMKKLNLMAGELNRVYGNEDGIPLIGEQSEPKKKFVLKSKTQKPAATADVETPPPPATVPSTTEPAMDATGVSAETPPAPQEGGAMAGMDITPEDAMSGMGSAPEEGGDMTGMDSMPEEGGDMTGMDSMPEDEMGDEETTGPTGLKTIQKLTGRLSQKIRSFDKDKGLDSQDIKYVVNSILSAIDLSKLDDEDREEILDKMEDFDEYGEEGEGDLDMSGEEDFDMGQEDEMGGMDTMPTEPEMSPVAESRVERVLANYFEIKPSEHPQLVEKSKRDFLNNKINKVKSINEISNMSESNIQKTNAIKFLNENPTAKFIGKTNKENLIFSLDGKQVKVTQRGRIL